ncbi:hypothetical protein AAE478_009745 [Parahypoxylon ruwenzoriense]
MALPSSSGAEDKPRQQYLPWYLVEDKSGSILSSPMIPASHAKVGKTGGARVKNGLRPLTPTLPIWSRHSGSKSAVAAR